MTDKELVDLMVAAPRAFAVTQPDTPKFNAKPGWALPPPAELILNGVPASHVANEVIVLVEQKRDIEAQRDVLRLELDWLESMHTLHGAVEILYVVDGYQLTLTYDGAQVGEPVRGATLDEAIDNAIAAGWKPLSKGGTA